MRASSTAQRTRVAQDYVIDPSRDTLITLAESSKIFPAINGKRKPLPTIYRHCTTGVRGVVMQTYATGGFLYTTRQAVQKFLDDIEQARLNRVNGLPIPKQHKRTELCRKRLVDKANQDVDAMLSSSSRRRKSKAS